MEAQIRKPDLWVVVDNSSTPAEDWSIATGVHYERVHEPRPIGWLRNRCIDIALKKGAEYIVFWDDDDFYPPTRISSGVEALEKNPTADISGSSKMYLLLTRENVLMTTGPFHDKHATAATWTVRRRVAETHRFDETKEKGEEVTFTKNWAVNVVQLPPEDMIVVMGHSRNTVDKSDLLKRPHVYNATIINDANGRMCVRIRWPTLPWDLFRSTFSV
jgi:glycosyltransferase involved in cell wall biosynthesis